MHAFLAPLARAWGAVAERKRLAWDASPARATHALVPTISVGGLEVGGSGKSPVTEYVLRSLLAQGRHPGLLTRGYGRKTRRLGVRRIGEPACPRAIGDEASMMVEGGLDVPVAAIALRLDGARVLTQLGCDALVLDDGFVHRALARTLDIVVLSSSLCERDLAFVPLGRLREGPAALGRAHLVWWHDKSGAGHDEDWQHAFVSAWAHQTPMVRSTAWLEDALDAHGQRVSLRGKRVVAACGIARPQTFRRALHDAGAQVCEQVAFADHAPGRPRRLRQALRCARRTGAEAIVVTAKDWPSWRPLVRVSPVPLWCARQRFSLWPGDEKQVQALLQKACSP